MGQNSNLGVLEAHHQRDLKEKIISQIIKKGSYDRRIRRVEKQGFIRNARKTQLVKYCQKPGLFALKFFRIKDHIFPGFFSN